MTYGIAAYKVTPEFCEDELNYILSSRRTQHLGMRQELGRDMDLLGSVAARNTMLFFMAFGVGAARRLDIPGEDLEGMVDAIRFIYDIRANGYPSVPVGDKVAVIGMGMTAIDAATQARRLGASEVTLVYRRTQEEMPCTETELNIAKLDGCRILWLTSPKAAVGDNGRLTGLVCSRMRLGDADSSGRRSPVDTGETVTLEVDMVIKAAGQVPFAMLVSDAGLGHDRGKVTSVDAGRRNEHSRRFRRRRLCSMAASKVVDARQAEKDAAAAMLRMSTIFQLA